jgi:hypothetical protein
MNRSVGYRKESELFLILYGENAMKCEPDYGTEVVETLTISLMPAERTCGVRHECGVRGP